jgi:sugar phosphate permease
VGIDSGSTLASTLSSQSQGQSDPGKQSKTPTSVVTKAAGKVKAKAAPAKGKALVASDAPAESCFYGWAIVGVCTLCLIAKSPGGSMMMAVNASKIRRDLEIGKVEFAGIFLVSSLLSGPIQLKFGALMDKYGGRFCIPAAQALFSLALGWGSAVQPATGMWYNYVQLGAIMLLLRSLAFGALEIFPHTCVLQWFEQRRGRAISIMNVLEFLGVAVIMPVVAIISAEKSWRSACGVGAICNLVLVPLGAILLRRSPESIGLHPDGQIRKAVALHPSALEAQTELLSKDSASFSDEDVFPPRSFRVFWIYSFFQGLLVCGTDMFMDEILDKAFYLKSGEATPLAGDDIFCMFLPHAFACSVSQVLIGEVLDRSTKAKTSKRLPVALLASGTLVMAFANLALIVVDTPTHATMIGMARGVCNGMYEMLLIGGLIFPTLGVPRDRIGTVLGYNQLAMIMGSAFGPMMFGLYENIFGNYWGILLLTSVPAFALGIFLTVTLLKSP